MRTQKFELAAMSDETEPSVPGRILTELESGEPDRIEVLKKLLEIRIKQAEETADMWRSPPEW